ncbi:unnamed protein product [Pleuronectes platessa]|uniref:Protein FAM198B n=1 Tax=Pleuronectes platessa TaxID=8262 RepID=A0A9N7VLY8_PLEPL|nr:unnamed protein product [Pleuronectes platessa]
MGKSRSLWLCFPVLRLTSSFWRCPLSRRSLIIATLCAVYLLFVVSYVGYSQQQRDRRTDKHKYRHTRGLETDGAFLDSADLPTGESSVVPTRSNVVYITLKFKRLKPANIRGTIRPKLRSKLRKNKSASSAFTQNKLGALERHAGQINRHFAPKTPWKETRDVDYKSLDVIHSSHRDEMANTSSIRIYSQRAPQWFSAQDVGAMRFLADAKGETGTRGNHTTARGGMCVGRCGVITSPLDTTEVFAFHLDRVLGLNRTLPAVGRKFRFLHVVMSSVTRSRYCAASRHVCANCINSSDGTSMPTDGRPCPVALWDASLYPEGLAAGRATVRLTWGGYQRSLKQRCWQRNINPRPDSDCRSIHHYEWSKLALFDFLLQIHNRLDGSCCGFRPRQEDEGHDPRHLVFTNNKGFFDRNEDNLDFRLLEGITELPEQAVSVLRSRRLRERLLQSLFLDQTYWESQGGRTGIDKLIDVIERRAKVLLTYINAHGIKVVTMNA